MKPGTDGLDKCFLFPIPDIRCPLNESETRERELNRELKSKKLPGSAYPRVPLKAFSLGPSFRKSVSIYPRSAPDPLYVALIQRVWHGIVLRSYPASRGFFLALLILALLFWNFLFKIHWKWNERKRHNNYNKYATKLFSIFTMARWQIKITFKKVTEIKKERERN